MQKKSVELNQIVPAPETIEAKAPNFKPTKSLEKTALRRSKVREFMKMGYGPHQISIVLSRGIKIEDGSKIQVPVTENIIARDITYIRQEAAAEDVSFNEKRADIIEKLRFLYNQAIREYRDAKGSVRNSFLNTALAVLNKIADIEGVKTPEGIRESLGDEVKVEAFATEVHKLNKDEQYTIITAIRKVVKGSKPTANREPRVPGKSSRVPAQADDDEGVPGKS